MSDRQIILDTETTGIDPKSGHCIIEIGCVELFNRELTGRHYHQYINPQREIEAEAQAVHGISQKMLKDKPIFADIVADFANFVAGAELIIHNAPFDIGHLNAELQRLPAAKRPHEAMSELCTVLDTLVLARQKHPGQRNSLDALCKRYAIDNSKRELHGALLDSQILAEVYLAMTGGQMELGLNGDANTSQSNGNAPMSPVFIKRDQKQFKIIGANEHEFEAHKSLTAKLQGESAAQLWD